jgi:hypothetical protein
VAGRDVAGRGGAARAAAEAGPGALLPR